MKHGWGRRWPVRGESGRITFHLDILRSTRCRIASQGLYPCFIRVNPWPKTFEARYVATDGHGRNTDREGDRRVWARTVSLMPVRVFFASPDASASVAWRTIGKRFPRRPPLAGGAVSRGWKVTGSGAARGRRGTLRSTRRRVTVNFFQSVFHPC